MYLGKEKISLWLIVLSGTVTACFIGEIVGLIYRHTLSLWAIALVLTLLLLAILASICYRCIQANQESKDL